MKEALQERLQKSAMHEDFPTVEALISAMEKEPILRAKFSTVTTPEQKLKLADHLFLLYLCIYHNRKRVNF